MVSFEIYKKSIELVIEYNKQIEDAYLLSVEKAKELKILDYQQRFSKLNKNNKITPFETSANPFTKKLSKSIGEYCKLNNVYISCISDLSIISISKFKNIHQVGDMTILELICLAKCTDVILSE